jgi:hypothetical protein
VGAGGGVAGEMLGVTGSARGGATKQMRARAGRGTGSDNRREADTMCGSACVVIR